MIPGLAFNVDKEESQVSHNTGTSHSICEMPVSAV